MAIDLSSPRSRRSLLTAALGGLAATAAATLAGAQRVLATGGDDGTPITVGTNLNNAQTATVLANATNNSTVFEAISTHGGRGLIGVSDTGEGVLGQSNSGNAVHGVITNTSGLGFAVLGEMTNPDGCAALGNNYATSGSAQGVQGTTDSPLGWATTGWARQHGSAIVGVSAADFPVKAIPPGTGVFGWADKGRAAVLVSAIAQVQLVPSGLTTHPASGFAGDLFVDRSKRLWFCKGGTTWKQIA